MIEKTCEHCRKSFMFRFKPSSRNAGKFCSQACHYASKQVTLTCELCKKSYTIGQSKYKEHAGQKTYCSKACSDKDKAKNIHFTKCKSCGKQIRNFKGQGRVYCSRQCKKNDKGTDKICPVCGKKYRAYFKQLKKGFDKYCSQVCHYQAHRTTKICPVCGKEFTRLISDNRQYCSFECARQGVVPWNKGKAGYITPKRRENQIKQGKAKKCICKWCGKEFYNPKWRIDMNMLCCCLEHARLFAKNRNTMILNCKGCGKQFKTKQRKEKSEVVRGYRSYCSDECRGKNYLATEEYCSMCGKKIKVSPSRKKSAQFVFCSTKCHNRGASLDVNLYNKTGCHITAIGQKMIVTKERYTSPHKGRKRPGRKYRPEHRVVVEEYIGRKLKKNGEPIWHLNGLPEDNRPENLYVFPDRSEIMRALGGAIPFPQKSNLDLLRTGQFVRQRGNKCIA